MEIEKRIPFVDAQRASGNHPRQKLLSGSRLVQWSAVEIFASGDSALYEFFPASTVP
jgi:hypothetical protein